MRARHHKVLLADDVLLELELEKTFFQRSGFQVITATDGLSALALATSEMPDIVVLDQVMPGLSGTEVCARLRAQPATKGVPVVITSSQDHERVRRACAASGVNSYVPKSDGKQALLHAVAQILRVPERKSTRLTVFFSVHGSARGKETLGKGVDLSEAGMCLEANRRYEVGVSLSLRFVLPGEKQEIQAQAVVKRLRALADETYSMGLEFTSLTEAMRERLNRYIDRSLCGS